VHQINSQYCQLYYQRLVSVMPRVKAAAEARWPGVPVCKVLELQDGQPCVVIGTVYKDMKLKPSILDEYVKDVRPRLVLLACAILVH
jgi:DNA polymerase delta subunit 2